MGCAPTGGAVEHEMLERMGYDMNFIDVLAWAQVLCRADSDLMRTLVRRTTGEYDNSLELRGIWRERAFRMIEGVPSGGYCPPQLKAFH